MGQYSPKHMYFFKQVIVASKRKNELGDHWILLLKMSYI